MYKMKVIDPISTGKIKSGLRPFDFKESGVLRDQIILKEGEINVTTLALDDVILSRTFLSAEPVATNGF